jgi:hypothetical protein
MKKLIVFAGAVLLSMGAMFGQDQNAAAKDTAEITFEKSVYDFGSLKPGSHTFEFVFTNTGTKDLQLTNVAPGCGCTKADWPKEPIKKGEKGIIKATYTASAIGYFRKDINIYSNAKNSYVKISFQVNVVDPSAGSAEAKH